MQSDKAIDHARAYLRHAEDSKDSWYTPIAQVWALIAIAEQLQELNAGVAAVENRMGDVIKAMERIAKYIDK